MKNEQLSKNLETLSPQQLEGFNAFKKWYEGPNHFGHVQGLGGTGKTYSIGKWCLELGIPVAQILGCGPTNNAANQLEKSLLESGLEVDCTTIHKALGLKPTLAQWRTEDEKAILELSRKLKKEGKLDEVETSEMARLDRIRKLAKERALIFVPSEETGLNNFYKLVIVDECSMVGEELIEILQVTFGKILYMGDHNQLFPVGESLSQSFKTDRLMDLSDIKRSKGELAKLNKQILQSKTIDMAYRLCLQRFTGNVKVVTTKEGTEIFENLVRTMEPDGLDYRFICFKNELVDKSQAFVKKTLQEDWVEGDLLVCVGSIAGWGYKGKGSPRKVSVMHSNQETEITYRIKHQVSIPVGHNSFKDISVYQCYLDIDDEYILYRADPYNMYKKEWAGSTYVYLVSFDDLKVYKKALDLWGKARGAFYQRNKTNESPTSQALFKLLGVKSWAEIDGSPGRKRFKEAPTDLSWLGCEEFSNRKSFPNGIEAKIEYTSCKALIQHVYYWLEELNASLKLRTGSTVYRAQGNTIRNVLLHLPDIYESRKYGKTGRDNAFRALYTAVSRASENLYIINK